jgi:Tfp pilus assembly protein PilP
MILKLLLGLLLMLGVAFAEVIDLEQLISELNQQPVPQTIPKLPVYQLSNTSYRMLGDNNLFDEGRLDESGEENYLQQYNLSQLQMVGFLNYAKIDYAFIKTPYETLRVKVGDTIQNGKVVAINKTSLEIIERQVEGERTYDKKIFLQLNESKNKKLPKLQIK